VKIKANKVTLVCWCAMLVAAVTAGAQGAVTAGPWTVELGNTGPVSIAYRGQVLARRGGLGGYLPAWKGTRFNMAGAERKIEGATVTWHKAQADNCDATLKVELTPQKATFSLDMVVTAAGPSEFSVQLVPEAVRTDEDRCLVWVGERLRNFSLRGPIMPIHGIKEMRFEQAQRTVIIRTQSTVGAWQMQDRRGTNGGLFFVVIIGSSGDQPREAHSSVELEVLETPEGERPGRAAFVSQQPIEFEQMPVANAGFEEGLEKWSKGPTAGLDKMVKHGGKQSAKLVITGAVEERGHVYITQQVPVTEGRRYQAEGYVKTQDVKAGTPSGMSSTGATVIIEFADKQGEWFASGSYAKGIYGTNQWRRVVTNEVRAPKGAGYAIIYLALRGYGTAWFDDVRLTEITHNVCLISPLTGTRVHDNTPTLKWTVGATMVCDAELAQDRSFPAQATIKVREADTGVARWEKPIPPGKWYWRVRSRDNAAVSPVWEFQQTASLDEDTTEPKIAVRHGWLAQPQQPIKIEYSDNVRVTKIKLSVDGRDVTADAKWDARQTTYAPDVGWSTGLHTAVLRANDAAGNWAQAKAWFTYSKPLPKKVWLKDGGVAINGKKRFLLGMYGVRIEDMPRIAAGGFDFVHSYQWDGAGTNEEALDYLDAAHKNGLQAFIGICRAELMRGNEEFVAERVGALMGHPALLAWYLYDEPDLTHQYVSPEWLERYYRLIKALDPFHPVVVTCAQDTAVPKYRDALDVHWTQVYGSTAYVSSRPEKHRRSLHADTPLALILHCYDRRQSSLLREGRQPNPAEFQPDARVMRANAYMALVHNSSGLIWWWYGQGSPRSYTVANVPEAWQALTKTVAEIKTLEPVLTAEGEVHTWVEEPMENVEVHLWEKKCADRTVMIAVNRDKQECEVTFAPRTVPQQGSLDVMFEGRQVGIAAGKVTDTFAPLAAHVYEVKTRK